MGSKKAFGIEGGARRRTVELVETNDWALIPVTTGDGRQALRRMRLYASDDGRMFVRGGSGFDEVSMTLFGGYRLTGGHLADAPEPWEPVLIPGLADFGDSHGQDKEIDWMPFL